jgi:molybdenum cofactor synthesis domain-containing protein
MRKTIPVKDAVGTKLAHDITEIRPGEFKGPAFKKGHTVCDDDICHLQRLGKNNLFVLDLDDDEIHEDDAAAILAKALSGDGIVWENEPHEGKIRLLAERDGLLQVDTTSLAAFNMVEEVMCATRHTHTLVKKGELVAATRAIPLVMKTAAIERAAAIAQQSNAVLSVLPLKKAKAGMVITGTEVYEGIIQDRYTSILTKKLKDLGSETAAASLVPDDADKISKTIRDQLDQGCDLILVTGGMSVDPDDVTRKGIQIAGPTEFHYGAAVLPGAMFLVAYFDDIPLLGCPACGLHHRTTILDLILPRILVGEKVTKTELALMGHGGLCLDCPECTHPHCPFGKGL